MVLSNRHREEPVCISRQRLENFLFVYNEAYKERYGIGRKEDIVDGCWIIFSNPAG